MTDYSTFAPDANYSQQQPAQYEQPSEVSFLAMRVVIENRTYFPRACTVDLNAHGAADSADVTLSMKTAPDFTRALDQSGSQASANNVVPIQVYFGVFESQQQAPQGTSIAGLTQIFSGQVDMFTLEFNDPYVVTFHCRSLAAQLIDNRITAIPRNMLTTQFVQAMAAQYGLTASIMLPFGQPKITVAQVYERDFSAGIQNDRIWDVLLKMAQIDDTDVWVVGSTLYYAAPSLIQRQTVDIKYGRDVRPGMKIVKSINGSEKIRVEVRTYNPKTKTSSIQRVETKPDGGVSVKTSSKVVTSNPQFGTANSSTTSISSTGAMTTTTTSATGGVKNSTATQGPSVNANSPLIYRLYRPNLTQQAANQLAQSTWRRISSSLYTASLPLSIKRSNYKQLLDITSLIRLHGVPMQKVNDNYYPRSIRFAFDIDAGASVDVEAINATLPAGQV